MTVKAWLKEPLVHFLLAGAALFVVGNWLAPPPVSDRVITVGREQAIEHLQARTQIYDEAQFDQLLGNMSPDERAELVRDVAVTEALWREGEALDLSSTDPLVRQRVIQQMRQLLMADVAGDVEVSEQEVEAFYADNQSRYATGQAASFSHVFFAGADGEARARTALAQLREGGDSGEFGDRFLYQRSYFSAGPEEIASQFGSAFAKALFAGETGAWFGPVRSDHGWHLIDLSELEPAEVPALDAIRDRVREDALADKRALALSGVLDGLMEHYEIEVSDDLAP